MSMLFIEITVNTATFLYAHRVVSLWKDKPNEICLFQSNKPTNKKRKKCLFVHLHCSVDQTVFNVSLESK